MVWYKCPRSVRVCHSERIESVRSDDDTDRSLLFDAYSDAPLQTMNNSIR